MVSEGKTREIFVTFPDIIHSFYARAKTKMENYLCSNGKIRGRLTLLDTLSHVLVPIGRCGLLSGYVGFPVIRSRKAKRHSTPLIGQSQAF